MRLKNYSSSAYEFIELLFLSLVEIVPINESSYVSDSDEDSLADLKPFDEDNSEDFYSPDEESNFDDIPYEDDFENSDSFPQSDFAEDDLNEDNPFDESDVSAPGNGSTSSLLFNISPGLSIEYL